MTSKRKIKSGIPVPVSALTLLQQEQERRQEDGEACCLLSHPGLSLPLGLTELAGPAGSGKTQIALTMICDVVLLQNRHAVYVSLGGSTVTLGRMSKRLEAIISTRLEKKGGSTTEKNVQNDYLTKIHMHSISNSDDLRDLLRIGLPHLLETNPNISLVVLDGIASLFRIQEEQIENPWLYRSTLLFDLSSRCKEISSKQQLPFLIINEATSKIPSDGESQTEITFANSNLRPALGLSWSQCVNSTFFVTRGETIAKTRMVNTTGNDASTENAAKTPYIVKRTLHCLKSPSVSVNSSISFYVDQGGAIRLG